MSKPAANEPSMDEILSSIRQIIADDDDPNATESAPKAEETQASEPVSAEQSAADAVADLVGSFDEAQAADLPSEEAPAEAAAAEPEMAAPAMDDDELEPLTLSTDQLVGNVTTDESPQDLEAAADAEIEAAGSQEATESATDAADLVSETELVDPDDIEFTQADAGSDIDVEVEAAEVAAVEIAAPEPVAEALMVEEPVEEPIEEEPAAPALPDPALSEQLSEELLAPATDAAVRGTFSKLNALAIGKGDQTIESMIKEMMRPMLKAWLDENLPSMVERVVEKEISRLSRGE